MLTGSRPDTQCDYVEQTVGRAEVAHIREEETRVGGRDPGVASLEIQAGTATHRGINERVSRGWGTARGSEPFPHGVYFAPR